MEKYNESLRDQIGYLANSLTEVSKESGVQVSTLSSFLNGNRGLSVANIAKLRKVGYPISVDLAIEQEIND